MKPQPNLFADALEIAPIDPSVGRDNGKFLGELARDEFSRDEARRRYREGAWPTACPKLIDMNLTWRNK